jgi:hypothetical protein
MAEEEKPAYTIPAPTLHEHYYLQAIVLELQRIRAALEAGPSGLPSVAVELKEPKPKPKREN